MQQLADAVADLALQGAALVQQGGGGGQGNPLGAGRVVHRPHRHVADAAPRDIHNPLERQIVGRAHGRAQIGDGVADFLALVEAQPANHAIGHAQDDQPFLEGAGLEAGAHQDRHFVQRFPGPAQRLDPVADHAGFFIRVPYAHDADLFAFLRIRSARAQRLAQATFVMRDQPRSRGQDMRGRAIIRFQPDDPRAIEILLEAEDVFHFRAAPGIDRLVVIPHAADVLVTLRQQPQPVILDQVGVLIFVHQDIPKRTMVLRQDVRVGEQDLDHMQHQIAEIGRVQNAQAGLIGLIQRRRASVREVRFVGRSDPRRGQPAILPALDRRHQGCRSPALLIDPFGLHHLFQDAQLVVRVQDGEIRGQPDMFGMPAQHPRTQGMECAQPQPLGRFAEDCGDPFTHLPGRLVGEGDGQDLVGKRAPGQQDMREPCGQHASLAGARPGQHQQRAVDGLHRLPLFRVQASQVIGHRFRVPCMRAA